MRYAHITDIQKVNEPDKQKALKHLLVKLQKAEALVNTEGTISADELEKELGRVIM